jgi:REP element-mobilizing transposase RayT
MANTYTQVYIHLVFSVKNRDPLISNNFRDNLHKYITGIIKKRDCKLLSINSMPDHIHILFSLTPEKSISNLVREIKVFSAKYINENKFCKFKFNWQEGYGAFSYSGSQVEKVKSYIENQEIHHSKLTFNEEYILFLKKFNVKYDMKYVF